MSGGRDDLAALQADVERSRGELAETVDQLTAKLDKRPSAKAVATGAAIATGVVVLLVALRRRRR